MHRDFRADKSSYYVSLFNRLRLRSIRLKVEHFFALLQRILVSVTLSSAEASYRKLFNNIGFGRACETRWEEGKGGRGLSSLLPLPGIPHALPFLPLPRPTAKKPLRSKQHERGLCGGEVSDTLFAKRNWKRKTLVVVSQ